MTAGELINNSIIPLQMSDTASMGLVWMEENHISHLPVVENNKYICLLSESDLLNMKNEDDAVKSICKSLPKPFIGDNEHYYFAAKILTESNFSLLPVLDEKNMYMGVITKNDLIDRLAESLSVHNPGGIIILELNINDYNISEISRIVESNDAKILSTAIRTNPESTKMEITLKLNCINIDQIIHTFNRFQYNIKAYYGEREDQDFFRERYDSLITYLNI